ncbi:nucleotidyltransferase domain-containing protein [Chromohalobacter japonicus]|uniref:nucleotidyltransferase domain-containing protein n=1 Tax=Chromohalobacter japonicus TaxID=223900 RepID=UPI001FF1C852|nr:nucleotidyltransferase domain-containing protein [Chromohalobacter japonicus]MCK0753542.1 nucleotidyltransferase domain-containing protein [Chromohalobacter japonicus]
MEIFLSNEFEHLKKASEFTRNKLSAIREKLDQNLSQSNYADYITVIATGSYGRGEASPESDLDLYIIFSKDESADEAIKNELEAIEKAVAEEVPNSAGDSGTFGSKTVISFSEMQQNIGGQYDTNESLTRRMLFLLEGTWLFGEDRFYEHQKKLLSKYIKSSDPDGKISKFLLNDIIRYYRTVATDFEFKTSERNKEWGLRSIKLRFSRKLLYFGGIIVVAETSSMRHEEKLQSAAELFSLPILERIKKISVDNDDKGNVEDIFSIYERFIEKISDETIRHQLQQVEKDQRHESEELSDLRELGKEFSTQLAKWLTKTYPANHPIHHSLIF